MATSRSKAKNNTNTHTVTVKCMVAFETDGSINVAGYKHDTGKDPSESDLNEHIDEMVSSRVTDSYMIELVLPRPVPKALRFVVADGR